MYGEGGRFCRESHWCGPLEQVKLFARSHQHSHYFQLKEEAADQQTSRLRCCGRGKIKD